MRKRGGASGKSRGKRATVFRSPLPETPISAGRSPLKARDLHFSAGSSPLKARDLHFTGATPSPQRSVGTIKDLKELFSSKTDAVKRILDHSHSEIVKELEMSRSRLSKRLKVRTVFVILFYALVF